MEPQEEAVEGQVPGVARWLLDLVSPPRGQEPPRSRRWVGRWNLFRQQATVVAQGCVSCGEADRASVLELWKFRKMPDPYRGDRRQLRFRPEDRNYRALSAGPHEKKLPPRLRLPLLLQELENGPRPNTQTGRNRVFWRQEAGEKQSIKFIAITN